MPLAEIMERFADLERRLNAMAVPGMRLEDEPFSRAHVLDEEGNTKPVSLFEYCAWRTNNPKGTQLGDDMVRHCRVSTVFIGIGETFETMVFGGFCNEIQRRYPDSKSAIKGHLEAVQWVREVDDIIGLLMERADGHDRSGDLLRIGI